MIKWKKISSFIYMPIKQFGAPSLQIIIDQCAYMLTIFKILEETQNNITINLSNAHFGKKTKTLRVFKMQDVMKEWTVKSAMVGRRKNFTQLFIAKARVVIQIRKINKNQIVILLVREDKRTNLLTFTIKKNLKWFSKS